MTSNTGITGDVARRRVAKEIADTAEIDVVSLRRGALSTLQRVYQIVSAHLYRAESRSAVAEQAWANATAEDADRVDVPEESVVTHIRSARTRAVAVIVDGNHPASITESAIDTLDHAIYAAIAETHRDAVQSPSQGSEADSAQHERRL